MSMTVRGHTTFLPAPRVTGRRGGRPRTVAAGVLVLACAGLARASQEFKSIQDAIERANEGEEIIVAPGVYKERIDFLGKSLTVRAGVPDPKNPGALLPGGHPADHIIVPPDDDIGPSLVTIAATDHPIQVVLEGFKVKENQSLEGAGISVRGPASAQILRCIVAENKAQAIGGGILVDPLASLLVAASAVINNEAGQTGSAIAILGGPPKAISIVNATIAANRGGDAALFMMGLVEPPCLYNNIIALNASPLQARSDGQNPFPMRYSMVGAIVGLVCDRGCITDPQPGFVDIAAGNFRLLPGSQGIDAAYGDPPCLLPGLKQTETDADGDPPYDDPATPDAGGGTPTYKDIGADEYFPIFIRADANADGLVDIGDAVSVLDYLFATGDNSCRDAVDCNDDGKLDIADPILTLRFLFARGQKPPSPYPEMGSDPTGDTLDCAYYGAHPAP